MLPGGKLFDRVVLIYDPVNRRVPLTLAESIRAELGGRLPDLPVALLATQHAGHARALASGVAATGAPLIVSVSGDGVYNAVVHGVLEVPGNHALVAVAAGGNANDHRRSTRRMPVVDAIVTAQRTGRTRYLDLLRLTARSAAGGWSHYAHSYIGFGLTPSMAVGLKRDRKGIIAELLSVLRTFTELTPVKIVRSGGRCELYDSLVFGNVTRMAKYDGSVVPADPTTACSRWSPVGMDAAGGSPPWRCAPRLLGLEPTLMSAGSRSVRSTPSTSRWTEKSSSWNPLRASPSSVRRVPWRRSADVEQQYPSTASMSEQII